MTQNDLEEKIACALYGGGYGLFALFYLCFCSGPTDDKQPVVIGRYDAPLSECLEPGMAMQVGIANVRVNSYATYDKNDGVQVHVELYVPWYSSPKPEFTGMTGNVKLTMNGQSTSKYFSEVATGDETISTDVDTGRKASSGTSGTVFVSGTAVALNALANGGQFSISYDITIP